MAGTVIVDTGPLLAFANIGQLALLKGLFNTLLIPQAVWHECKAKPGKDTESIEKAMQAGWISLRTVTSGLASPSLGQGEIDCISLAMQAPNTSLLILDDRLARRYAMRAELHFIGTVRVLHLAQQRGLIADARTCIQAMAQNGYRISLDLLQRI